MRHHSSATTPLKNHSPQSGVARARSPVTNTAQDAAQSDVLSKECDAPSTASDGLLENAPKVDFGPFFANLLSEHGVSSRACASVASFVRQACTQSAEEARNNPSVPLSQLPTVSYCANFFGGQSKSYCVKKGPGLVEPTTVFLGSNSDRNPSRHSFQYVSVTSLLEELFKNEVVVDLHFDLALLAANQTTDISDFYTGSYHRDQLEKVQLILYIDDFQVSNPLGNKAQKLKLTGIYLALGYPKLRSQVKHIFVVALFRAAYFKTHRAEILGHVARELKSLEESGIWIQYHGKKIQVQTRLVFVIADNLAAHTLAGFTECFRGSKLICRYCHASTSDIQSKFSAADFNARTKEGYQKDLAKLEESDFCRKKRSACGINAPCELSILDSFHVLDSFPPDISHDIFEGVARTVISSVLQYCIEQGYVTLEQINHEIVTFAYSGSDGTNKPQPLRVNGKKVLVKETAKECEVLLNLLPLLIGNKIPEDCEQWRVLLKLVQLVRIFSAWTIPRKRLDEIQYSVEEWLETYRALFPSVTITPKFHYLIHYTAQIEKHGCPTYCKTLRFEGKHQELKKFASQSKNRINLSKTIVKKHQRSLCLKLRSRTLFAPRIDFVAGDSPRVKDIPDGYDLGVKVHVNGVSFGVGDVIFYKSHGRGDGVSFAMVDGVLRRGDDLRFLCRRLNVENFVEHIMSYRVSTTPDVAVVAFGDLTDFKPSSLYMGKYVTPHRHWDFV